MKRGDIVYIHIDPEKCTGSEETYSRPAVIVSNDKCNRFSSVIEVVYMSASKKPYLPTHVTLTSSPRTSTVLCEAVYSVARERVQKRIGHVSAQEMKEINRAIALGLGLI